MTGSTVSWRDASSARVTAPAGPSRVRRALGGLACTAPVAGVGAVFASFTATTTNPGNSIETGTVAISDNDSVGVPLFTTSGDAGNLPPGYYDARCIVVTYTGSLPAEVRFYVESPVTGPGATATGLFADVDTTAPFYPSGACDDGVYRDADSENFSTAMANLPTTFEDGYDPYPGQPWVTGESRTYIFYPFVLDETTPNARTQELATDPFTLRWEARNI